MGTIQFDVEYPEYIPAYGLDRADFVTFDGRIIPSQTTLEDRTLVCVRPRNDSSHLRLLYRPHPRAAPVITHSTSLCERSEPYRLEVELARGELSRLRNYFGIWTGAGLAVSDTITRLMHDAQRTFFRSATASGSAADAIESLLITRDAIGELCRLYTGQRLAWRRERTSHFPVSLGCSLHTVPRQPEQFLKVFSSAALRTRWSDLEPKDGHYEWDALDELVDWATEHRLLIQGGPLIDLVDDTLPEWIRPWKSDLVNLQSFAADFVETVVSRYIGRIRHWEIVCGGNRGDAVRLSEEDRLNLVIAAVEAARQVDEQIQISLRIVQPWGESLGSPDNCLSPIQFIDTLRRTGVRISDVSLDIRVAVQEPVRPPFWSLPRDHLGLSQLLDHWSLLQMPLNVVLGLPRFFPDSERPQEIAAGQAQWIHQTLLMCLSKERVTGIVFDPWESHDSREGLLRSDSSLHPAWNVVRCLEEECWSADLPQETR